jgi:phosphoenolpyruvate synthase/pyruvate phosphate dikinase
MKRKILWKHLMSRRWTILRTELFTKGYIEPLKTYIGISNRELLVTKELEASSLYNSLDSMNEISLALLKKLKNDSDFGLRVYKDCITSCEYLVKVSKDVSRGSLQSLTSRTLIKMFDTYVDAALKFTPFLALPPNYEIYVMSEIKKSLIKKVGENKSEEYLQKLMSLKEYPFQMLEQIDLAKIALKIKDNINIDKLLKVHKYKYQWLSCYNFDEAEFSPEDFKKRLEVLQEFSHLELIKKTKGIVEKLKSDETEFQRVVIELDLSKELFNKVKLLREFVFLRTYRIEMNSQSNFYLQPFLREISERGNISIRQLAMMLSNEIKSMLLNGKVPDSINFNDREEYAVFWLDNAKYHHAFGNKAKGFISKQIVDVKRDNQVSTVHGTTASLGKTITGKVRLLNKNNMSEFKRGEILVTTMTSPEFVPAMHKAVAIVTDEGGVTCHAAIVSREFNIPCIVGTGNATKVFVDGDYIEVNSKLGTAKIYEN